MAQRDMTKQPPIGYWLKHLDEVITRHTDQVLNDNGFTRFRWQVLNLVYEAGAIAKRDIFATMKTFIDAHQLDETANDFVKEGWLVEHGKGGDTELALTDAGKTEHDAIFKLQSEVRRRVMQGVTEQEYMTVIDVLQRMVKNLE